MQALILAGGEGTRLRPLTSTIPKPVVPLVDRPFMAYVLEWLVRHGVEDVILSCGFMAAGVREVLGDGERLGIRLRYLEEPRPLGTGGALKFAGPLLESRFLMLNGDVLSDIDLTAQLAAHEGTGARVTLGLVAVGDPSSYGLVRRHADGAVAEFVEKPSPDQIDTSLINAGAYVIEREVLDGIGPAGTQISIERDVFPALVGKGLFGFEAHGYWLDIGTPQGYLQAMGDILEGKVQTALARRLADRGMPLVDGARIEGSVLAPALAAPGTVVERDATVGPRSVLGPDAVVGEGARVEHSALLAGARIGAHSTVAASIVGPAATIGEHCRIGEDVVIGEGARIGARSTLGAGARIFPGVEVPEASSQP